MQLKNGTPWALAQFVDLDRTGAEHMVVVLKAEYSIREGGRLGPVDAPEPPRAADVFAGDPTATAIVGEAELVPPKPGVDVLLTGDAIAPRRGTRVLDVRLELGPLSRTVRVHGERRWKRSLARWTATDPEPFDRVPLSWENAYGGRDETPKDEKHHAEDPRNPVGRGFRAKRSGLPREGDLLPNLEDPETPLRKPGGDPPPRAFGPIGRHWVPRRRWAGTYDEKWIAERMPLLPDDFDERFHQAAPPGQILKRPPRPGTTVRLAGCVAEGRLDFAFPAVSARWEARLRSRVETGEFALDTIGIDAAARRLRLLLKGRVRVHGELPDLRWIAVEEADGG